ncbi:MAG: hypothetical protein WAL71_19860, partial [Terriglobales bacterium]
CKGLRQKARTIITRRQKKQFPKKNKERWGENGSFPVKSSFHQCLTVNTIECPEGDPKSTFGNSRIFQKYNSRPCARVLEESLIERFQYGYAC